jgi:hypothetical protein
LSLPDLAKVGPSCKLFQEVLLDRCDADQRWLGDAAIEMFGRSVVDFLLQWLTRISWEYNDPSWDRRTHVIDLTKGDTLPEWDACLVLEKVVLIAPARGLLDGNPQESTVMWQLQCPWKDCTSDIKLLSDDAASGFVEIQTYHRLARFCKSAILAQGTTQMVACLGLLNLACKEMQKANGEIYRPCHHPTFQLNTGWGCKEKEVDGN